MKKFLVLAAAVLIAGCSPTKEVVEIYQGPPGANGTSCTVAPELSEEMQVVGARISCTDNTWAVILNGEQGLQGVQGQPGENALANAIGIEGYIYPCGINFNNDEIFLRLTDGKILALYDGGANQDRLVLLAPGSYITTDVNNQNQACHFSVSNDARPKVTSDAGWPASTGVVQ